MTQLLPLPFIEADRLSPISVRFQQVLEHLPPNHLAYVSTDESLTYTALAAASRGLASALAAQLGYATERTAQKAVALLLPNSADTLVGILGTLEAGHFYVPLDLVMGEAMLQQIVADCPPQALVTTTALREKLSALLSAEHTPPILCIDTIAPSTTPLPDLLAADAQLYASIQYTSGSTGKPRGVIRTHATNLQASYLAYHDFGLTPCDRVSHLRSYAHASSTQAIFGGLLNGATLYTHPTAEMTPTALYEWIETNAITHLNVSLGLLRSLADLAETHQPLSSLRVVITGGEAVNRDDVERLYRLLPAPCKLIARLVSTEAGSYARFVIEPGKVWSGHQVPAGYAPPGCQVMIVDENLQPLPDGQLGEIAVRSRFLCAGYWNRPVDTTAKFLLDGKDDPQPIFLTGDVGCLANDGLLEHVGRKDFMVKIRGYRVQLEEVEAALSTLPMVQRAVVVAQPLLSGEKRLVAYIVPQTMPGPATSELRQALRDRLPTYMMPALFQIITRLPLTAAGKVDRQALPPPGKERPASETPFVAPRTTTETQLATLWEELLEVHPIGVQDDFFALGGNSLALLKLATRLKRQFGREVSLKAFLQGSTIEKLAQLLDPSNTEHPLSLVQQGHVDLPPLTEADTKRIAPFLFGQQGAVQPPTGQPQWHNRWLPFATRIRLLYQMCRISLVQTRFFPQERQLLHAFLPLIGVEPAQTNDVVAAYLMRRLCARYYKTAQAHALWRNPQQLVVLSGQNVLAEARQKGCGILLLNTHSVTPSGGILPIILKQLGYGDFMLYSGKAQLQNDPALRNAFQQYFSVTQNELLITKFLSLQMEVAQQKLRAGGIVWIAPDGGSGQRTVTLPVLGQERTFSTGFAELSLETGAVAIPTRCVLLPNGTIQVTFLPPLASGAPTVPHDEQVLALMQQYAAFLAETWQRQPGNIEPGFMKRYIANRASNTANQQVKTAMAFGS